MQAKAIGFGMEVAVIQSMVQVHRRFCSLNPLILELRRNLKFTLPRDRVLSVNIFRKHFLKFLVPASFDLETLGESKVSNLLEFVLRLNYKLVKLHSKIKPLSGK